MSVRKPPNCRASTDPVRSIPANGIANEIGLSDSDAMKVTIKNVGPIKNAEIKLGAPLTLFTGKNNTGKTYAAWTIYGLLRDRFFVDEEGSTGARELARALLSGSVVSIESVLALSHELAVQIARRFRDRLPHFFASDSDRFTDSLVQLDLPRQPIRDAWTDSRVYLLQSGVTPLALLFNKGLVHAASLAEDETPENLLKSIASGKRRTFKYTRDGHPAHVETMTTSVQWTLQNIATGAFMPTPHVFPAERGAALIFGPELQDQRRQFFERMSRKAPRSPLDYSDPISVPVVTYPQPIRDHVFSPIKVGDRRRSKVGRDLANELERLIGGSIKLKANSRAFFTPDGKDAPDISVNECSSVVKSLFSLVDYLRYEAQIGDMMVIDEPELCLHPAGQRAMGRFLARVARKGIRVLATTHSDFLVREIHHLVMLGGPGRKMRKLAADLHVEPDELLQPADVAVYNFSDGVASNCPVSVEEGIASDSFDDAVTTQNLIAQRIAALQADSD